jgi:hypothetical protein
MRYFARFNGDDRAFLLPAGFEPFHSPSPIYPQWMTAHTHDNGEVRINLDRAYVIEEATDAWAASVESAVPLRLQTA